MQSRGTRQMPCFAWTLNWPIPVSSGKIASFGHYFIIFPYGQTDAYHSVVPEDSFCKLISASPAIIIIWFVFVCHILSCVALMANVMIILKLIASYCEDCVCVSYFINKSTKLIMCKKDLFGILCSSGFLVHR